MDIQRDRKTITITSIHDEATMLSRKHKTSFLDYIADELILYLQMHQNEATTFTYKDILILCSLISDDYYKAKYHIKDTINSLELTGATIFINEKESYALKRFNTNYFFNVTNKILREIVNNALKILERKQLISYERTFVLYESLYNKSTGVTYTRKFFCTPQEKQAFIKVRQEVMQDYKLTKTQDLVFLNKQQIISFELDLSEAIKAHPDLHGCSRYANAFELALEPQGKVYTQKRSQSLNHALANTGIQYKLHTTKELDCMNSRFKQQLINSFIM